MRAIQMQRFRWVVSLLTLAALAVPATVWGTGEYDRLMVIKKRANTLEHRIEHFYVRMRGQPAYEDQWGESWIQYDSLGRIERSRSRVTDRSGGMVSETTRVSHEDPPRHPNEPPPFGVWFQRALARGELKLVGTQTINGREVKTYINERPIDEVRHYTGPYVADLPGDKITWKLFLTPDLQVVRSERTVSGGSLAEPLLVWLQEEILNEVLPVEKYPGECLGAPDIPFDASGKIIRGKRVGDLFAYLNFGGPDRTLRANSDEMILLILIDPHGSPPQRLKVLGTNLQTGTVKEFEAILWGTEWGLAYGRRYVFPEPGCWELRPINYGHQGSLILEVKPESAGQ